MKSVNKSNVATLLEHINAIDKMSDSDWKSTLNDRKIKELEFHDRDRDRSLIEEAKTSDTYEKLYGNRKYYSATQRSNAYIKDWIRKESEGKVFLDYACGDGGNAIFAAQCGAALSLGFDLSSVSVRNARNAAIEAGAEATTRFFQADAENTKLPANSIDVIICSGMLHHLDLSYALPELRRILKPGGKILAGEALDYNPAIKLYRYFTPAMRTDWEKAHILSLKDLKFAERFFSVGEVKFWHITGILAPHLPFIPMFFFEVIDKILTSIPLVRLLAWIFTFELIKGKES